MTKDHHTRGYADARAKRDALELTVSMHSATLKAFPKGPMGLTPDDIKFGPAYRTAKAAYDRAFAELRDFNAEFVKQYAKDIERERASRKERTVNAE
jgi:hypothetical protein